MNQAADVSAAPCPAFRRRAWLVLAGAAAAGAGPGLAWWRRRPAPLADAAGAPLLEALWQGRWPTPQGGVIDGATLRGRPLLVNFWATWCPPCVEELPLLEGFYRQHAANGWQVLGLAIDNPDAVGRFLKRLPLSFPVGIAGPEGLALSRTLGNMTGGLPFTLVVSGSGQVLARKIGKVRPEDLLQYLGAAA